MKKDIIITRDENKTIRIRVDIGANIGDDKPQQYFLHKLNTNKLKNILKKYYSFKGFKSHWHTWSSWMTSSSEDYITDFDFFETEPKKQIRGTQFKNKIYCFGFKKIKVATSNEFEDEIREYLLTI